MSTELVTAHAGKNHVDASDIGALYAGALGGGRYALDVGEGLAVSMTDANTLHIGTGGFIFDGRWVRVTDGGEDVKIANGSQGAYRKDLVTYTYTRDPSSGNIEEGKWGVAQGTAASKESDAKVPAIEEGDILDGALTATCAVAEVDLDGLTPTAKLLLPSVASLKTLGDSVSQDPNSVSVKASASWLYISGYACAAGVIVGGNVNPGNIISKGNDFCTITTDWEFSNTGRTLLRGAFPNKQSGVYADFSDGHTIVLRVEQQVTLALGDTFSILVPCMWKL